MFIVFSRSTTLPIWLNLRGSKRVLLMPKPRMYFLFSVFFYLFFSVSVSKGDENQSLTQIESGQGSAKKYARFISHDPAMRRVLKLSKGTAERERTEKLLQGLDWDLGDSKIRFYGNPLDVADVSVQPAISDFFRRQPDVGQAEGMEAVFTQS